jgi:hypothetical protein
MRRTLLSILTGGLTGILVLGVAWATAGLVPISRTETGTPLAPTQKDGATLQDAPPVDLSSFQSGERLPGGTFLVGAHDASIAPKTVAEGGQWTPHNPNGGFDCGPLGYEYTPLADPSCLRTFDRVWATGVDQSDDLGIYARAMAISNGKDTLAFVVLDAVSWFYGYDPSICPDDPAAPMPQDTCGTRAITNDLSAEFAAEGINIPVKNFVIASTHTHASADTTSKTPTWYYEFVRDQIKVAVRKAVHSMQPAQLQTGAIPAKAFNVDRRIVTRAVPDAELNWLRAVAIPTTTEPTPEPSPTATPTDRPGKPPKKTDPSPTPTPEPEPTTPPAPETIATMVNFSVHPTVTAGNADMHSGFIGHLSERLGQLWGGSTVFYPGGLGDQTVNRGFGRKGIGYGLANLVYESAQDSGYTLRSNEIVSEQRIITVPADNDSLVAANKAGIFMRDTTIPGPHATGPSTSVQQKGRARTPSCATAGKVSVLTPVGGFRIGTPGLAQGQPGFVPGDRGDSLVIMQTPGEIFASISLTTKDYLSRSRNVMVLGMSNDHIGYIIPKEQYDTRGANAVGIAQPSIEMTNYEESLSTGSCTGDQVQNALVEIGQNLGVLGSGESR